MSDLLHRLASNLADRYRFERELGTGGWATVFLAEDVRHQRRVAVKVLRPEVAAALGGERFRREIEIAARLRHPHILPLYDSGDADGLLYYVMPYIEGESLRELLDREQQLQVDHALQISEEVAEALAFAHSRGVIHRDIKPENIMLDAGHAVVADFGIARAVQEIEADRLTETGMAIGTPVYMSPEQAVGERQVDPRSDIYSLGCTTYEMLVGEPPFTGPTLQAVIARRMTEAVPRITTVRDTVPPAVEALVMKALGKVPADRFASAEELASALRRERTVLHQPRVAAPPQWSSRRAGLVLGGVAILAIAAWLLARAFVGAELPGLEGQVLVVAPFDNLSGDSGQDYFVDGMRDALITELTKVADLTVITGVAERIPAEEAPDAMLLAGSVLPIGHRVRINARLVEASTNRNVWAESYEGDLRDVLALHGRVARAITQEVEAELTPQEETRLGIAPPVDPEAYNLYLRGRFHWNKRTAADLQRAVQYFQQAINVDPGDALAYAGLADAYVLFPLYRVPGVSDGEAYRLAERSAREALARDSTLGEARTALAAVLFQAHRDWSRAALEFQRALALSPGYATLHQWYSEYLRAAGRVEESLAEARRAYRLDPLEPVISTSLASGLWVAGRHEEAIAEARRTLDELDPSYSDAYNVLALCYLALSRFDELATTALQAGYPSSLVTPVIQALTEAGSREDAVGAIRTHETLLDPFQAAVLYSAVGEKDLALESLERAEEEGNVNLLIYLRSAPTFEELRGEARYQALLQKLGVPDTPSADR